MAHRRVPTAQDVAARAGVSRMTVSSVLNGTAGNVRVSQPTRQRVLAAAAELGYSPDPAARALRSRRSRIIGFVPRSGRAGLYEEPVSYLLDIQIARAAMRHGYHVVEASAETAASRGSDELVRFLLGWRVDGVILDSPDSACEVERFIDHGLPIVQLMRPQLTVPTSTITVDAARGIAEAIDHLVGLGHRAIAFFGSAAEHPVDRARRDGFRVALARHGLDVPGDYIRFGVAYSIAEGYALTRAVLALATRPTAILTAGDNLTLGALRALYEAHVRVPDEISIISYDDTFVGHLFPPITSVAQPLDEVADRATALIAGRLDPAGHHDEGAEHLVLPTRLVVRHSTRPPRGGMTPGRTPSSGAGEVRMID